MDISQNIIDQFDEECKKIHKQLENNLPKDTIYHYTNYEGLCGILRTKKLRYTDYRYLNDPTEIQYGFEMAKKTIINSNINIKSKCGFLGLFDEIIKKNWYKIYVTSFSTSIKKLALWRYYAGNGTGFAIGFNKNFYKVDNSPATLGKPCICKIIYDQLKSLEIFNQFIDVYNKFFCQITQKDLLDVALASHIISLIPSLKEESFSDEDELRLFCTEGRVGDPEWFFPDHLREFVPIKTQTFPFINSINGIKPTISPGTFTINDISEIWVGPCCNFIEAKAAIKEILKNEGYLQFDNHIDIKQAPHPYRSI